MTDSSRAVFLSYASEDAEAAQRVARRGSGPLDVPDGLPMQAIASNCATRSWRRAAKALKAASASAAIRCSGFTSSAEPAERLT